MVATAFGWSSYGMWPASSMMVSVASGMRRLNSAPIEGRSLAVLVAPQEQGRDLELNDVLAHPQSSAQPAQRCDRVQHGARGERGSRERSSNPSWPQTHPRIVEPGPRFTDRTLLPGGERVTLSLAGAPHTGTEAALGTRRAPSGPRCRRGPRLTRSACDPVPPLPSDSSWTTPADYRTTFCSPRSWTRYGTGAVGGGSHLSIS